MRFQRLEQWLTWQECLHPTAMDLGLARVHQVVSAMAWPERRFVLITVAGTNGKGSCVAYLDAIYRAAGYRTGTYTSPHLQRYNERIKLNGQEVADDALMESFARLDEARGDTTITYFEYGTLAAYDQFERAGVDVAILEVGIGGRLDAVNVFDADAALLTTVDIDHQKWLGDNREAIGYQKAGIFRSQRPAICADASPPVSVSNYAAAIGAELNVFGREFSAEQSGEGWVYREISGAEVTLPKPGLPGCWQQQNAAGAVAVVRRLSNRLPVSTEALADGVCTPQLRGRFEQIGASPDVYVDVAHNAQATATVADNLRAKDCRGRSVAVVAMLADKDISASLAVVVQMFAAWHVAPTDGPRGLPTEGLARVLLGQGVAREQIHQHQSTRDAFDQAKRMSNAEDCIVVFGSFHTVGDVLDALDDANEQTEPKQTKPGRQS
jgi:dihydrofolate synthase / folylpolyglutamate synthase